MKQPKARKKETVLEMHGDKRIDNYFWLRDRENPEVINYLNAENAYRTVKMQHTEPLQAQLYTEIVGRIVQTDMSVPMRLRGYYYYTRFEEGSEYPLHARKKGSLEATEEILLDVPKMAEGYAYYAVGGKTIAPDNRLMAFGIDTVSRRLYTIFIKNLENQAILSDKIDNTTGTASWSACGNYIFYTAKDPETLRAHRIFRHKIGTQQSDDVLIFEEKDETFGCYVTKSKSEKFLIIGSYATVSSEYQYLDASDPTGTFKIFEPRRREHEYSIDHAGDKFYILTNDNAKNFRLMTVASDRVAADFSQKNWTELVPHRSDVLLEGFEVFKDFLVLSERKNGITQLFVQKTNADTEGYYIDFGEEVYLAYTGANFDYDTEILRLGYTSLATPNSVFDFNMATKTFDLLKQEAVLDPNFDTKNYVSKRLYATAADGVKVPISLVYNKKHFKKRQKPLLLYAYGSYGHSMDVHFSSARLSLLDRGFVFAIAHIRGGQDLGRTWYENGKLLEKKNTFTDFIACGETLIAEGYVAKSKLFASGGSAGGLLMGAIMNMRPDIWAGVIAAVPFVDVVTTMLDESIPLTTGEFDEWGNPKDPIYYNYMKSYSPYDNVSAQAYPPTLITTGLHDSQVQYWEPAKWIAKLREMRTNKRTPLYLFCNMETGHGGASGRFARYKEVALEYAFLLDLAKK